MSDYHNYNLAPLVDILTEIRAIYSDFTINQALVLMQVAMNPGITGVEVIKKTGLSDASVSRISAILSNFGNRGTPALNLIRLVEPLEDRRSKQMFLSPQGEMLFRHVNNHLERYRHGRSS